MADTQHGTDRRPSMYGLFVLRALQGKSHVYAGTVPEAVKRQRRVKNAIARRQRRDNEIEARQ